ncbi:PepSY-like domain-containing protein [Spirosoma endophyticum]|uniref:Putative beta-lactamase-inhibitor-like, PepSY-like n=1 Tax=Spirosoma endophyticum TaxID=662367 RepID=A0A1I1RS63_9BACT|nr:PepSY-like domain-containing protein [Spirosoma endophyticum]SFD36877.1 Putative beta-lactamase-inhibitor-like, PepSY-like [Spirosoma endophyticum]
MKTLLVFSCVAALVVSLNACNHNSVDPSTDGSARTSGAASTTLTGPHNLTTVDVSSLPTTITTYISTNYAGATVKEAKKDEKGNYVVAITVNGSVKLLLFATDGTFVKVADGKPKHRPGDSTHHRMPGDSVRHHPPGDSAHHPKPAIGDSTHHPRPGKGPDLKEVTVSSLPVAITTYITANYAGSTINKAVQEAKTSDYIVSISTADSKRALLLFSADGTFKKAVSGK